MKFYPYKKGGGKSFNHAEGGRGIRSFGVVLTWLDVLAIVNVGVKSFHPLPVNVKSRRRSGHVRCFGHMSDVFYLNVGHNVRGKYQNNQLMI